MRRDSIGRLSPLEAQSRFPLEARTHEAALRRLLWIFFALACGIFAVRLASGNLERTILSGVSGILALALMASIRWIGVRRAGYVVTILFCLVAAGAMASGEGIRDVSLVLFPAGMLMGAMLLDRRHSDFLVFVSVATVAGIGIRHLGTPAAATGLADVVVVSILLLVSGALGRLVVSSLQTGLTRRREAESDLEASRSELERRNESLQLVTALSYRLQDRLDVDSIAAETVDVVAKRSDAPLVSFYLLEAGTRRLRMVAGRGFTGEEAQAGSYLPADGSLSGAAMKAQHILVAENAAEDRRVAGEVADLLVQHGVATILAVPLVYGGNSLGSLNVLFTRPVVLTPLDRDTYQAIAQAAALAIANAHLIEGLEHEAFHDPLTGLPNRAQLHRRFREIREAGPAEPVGMVLLNLNRFRMINDALGHRAGDELLVRVAARLLECAAGRAEVFRLGSDEFAALIAGPGGGEAVESFALDLLAALASPFDLDGTALPMGATAGVAIYPDDAGESHELLRCADVAMTRARQAVAPMARYERDQDFHTPESLAMVSELGKAIRAGALELHFQPVVSLDDGGIRGFEALVRWPHEKHGLLMPTAFLPLAEGSDLIHSLTYWVMERAIEQQALWSRSHPGLTMSVNLSVRNLLDINCSRRLEEIIERFGVNPALVQLELTETAVVNDPEMAAMMLGRITASGVRLAIDDFGTGYSSLAHLRRFPVHSIKIDRSFVSEMADGGQSHAIVRSTVELARSLGLTVIAEGIEDRRTADALREMRCELAQGHYFAPAAPAAENERRLREAGPYLM